MKNEKGKRDQLKEELKQLHQRVEQLKQAKTERVQAEEALRKAHVELERLVEERTAELSKANEALRIELTEREQAESHTNATNALLELFARKFARKEYLDAVVELIRRWSGCRCVGIRVLDEQGDIPYESYVGYSQEFVKSECWLSIERDQCACIRVITEKPEPQDASVMTPAGSFRCDNTIEFVGELSEEERARFRGVCVQSGFASLAIVPKGIAEDVGVH